MKAYVTAWREYGQYHRPAGVYRSYEKACESLEGMAPLGWERIHHIKTCEDGVIRNDDSIVEWFASSGEDDPSEGWSITEVEVYP